MSNGDLLSMLFFGAIAVFVIFRLKSSLGEHNEEDVNGPGAMRNFDASAKKGNVVEFPGQGDADIETEDYRDMTRDQELLDGMDDATRKTLETLMEKDSFFTVSSFLEGAGYAFDMIVNAHAKGDTTTLKDLLGAELYRSFEEDIKRRELRNETLSTTLVAIKEPVITKAEIKGKSARITAVFTSEQMRNVQNASGDIVSGSSSAISKVKDVWTFERVIGASNPNWTLVETGEKS